LALVEVIPAALDQEPILANLLELYAHDFSEFHDVELGADGRFGYKHLRLYWLEPNRHPFLIRVDGKLAGLMLVKRGSEVSNAETIWDMTEFFVIHGYRRRGVGMSAAHEVWRRFPGLWEVRVMESNHAARQFWMRAISTFADRSIPSACVQQGDKCWRVFSFESERRKQVGKEEANAI
jgi:predicted acetyltransferase